MGVGFVTGVELTTGVETGAGLIGVASFGASVVDIAEGLTEFIASALGLDAGSAAEYPGS